MVFQSHSPQETESFAQELAKKYLNRHAIFCLSGDLGAGKTVFAQGFAKGLGIQQKILSPTFLLVRQYPIPNSEKTFYHLDLYRFEEKINTIESGFQEIFDDPHSLVLIEWAEKLGDLPHDCIQITINKTSDHQRQIVVAEK